MAQYTLKSDPGVPYNEIDYIFDAPKEKVYKAMTDPELIPQWWGPAKYKTTVVKQENKVGGVWEYHQVDASNNTTHRFQGVYHDLEPAERMIGTFEYLEMPERGHVILQKALFEEKAGKTYVHIHETYMSQEDRDGMLAAGMEQGMGEGIDRLGKLVENK